MTRQAGAYAIGPIHSLSQKGRAFLYADSFGGAAQLRQDHPVQPAHGPPGAYGEPGGGDGELRPGQAPGAGGGAGGPAGALQSHRRRPRRAGGPSGSGDGSPRSHFERGGQYRPQAEPGINPAAFGPGTAHGGAPQHGGRGAAAGHPHRQGKAFQNAGGPRFFRQRPDGGGAGGGGPLFAGGADIRSTPVSVAGGAAPRGGADRGRGPLREHRGSAPGRGSAAAPSLLGAARLWPGPGVGVPAHLPVGGALARPGGGGGGGRGEIIPGGDGPGHAPAAGGTVGEFGVRAVLPAGDHGAVPSPEPAGGRGVSAPGGLSAGRLLAGAGPGRPVRRAAAAGLRVHGPRGDGHPDPARRGKAAAHRGPAALRALLGQAALLAVAGECSAAGASGPGRPAVLWDQPVPRHPLRRPF